MGYPINPMAIFDFPNQTTHTDFYTFSKRTYTQARDYSPNANVQYAEKWLKTNKPKNTYSSTGTKRTHRVRRGESLSKIASKYGTSVNSLCRLNGISRNTKIQVGKVLRVR